MFKEYINTHLASYFKKHGKEYRIMADLCFIEAIYYAHIKKIFEEQLKQNGYVVDGGFIRLK